MINLIVYYVATLCDAEEPCRHNSFTPSGNALINGSGLLLR